METLKETAAETKGLAVGEPGGSVSETESKDKDRVVYDLNEDGGDNNTVMVVNRRLVVTETTVEMRYVGSDHNGSENIVQENNASNVSVEKGEFNGNGISLVVDVHGSMDGVNENDAEKKFGIRTGEGLYTINGGDLARSTTGVEEKSGKEGVIDNWEKVGEDFTIEEDDDGGGEIVGDKKHDFAVGDFVWGKIKSHPWWPGQIYDPSDASEFASKFKHEDRLLVAYFGDGSCAWCFPSQLVAFGEQFEEMSKQSNSKSFDNAVRKALDEIGRRAELKMICACVPEGNRVGLTRPQAVNSGVKPGVLVPEGDIDTLATPKYEPAEVLEYVRHHAQAGSIINMLDLVLVKSWLSAFYRVKRGCRLPIYHEPQQIEGLEDKSKNVVLDTNDFSVPIEVPIQGPLKEDCLSSPKAGPGKGPMLSEEKLNQSRKQKSVAELMGEDTGIKPKSQRKSKSEEGTPSTTVKKKKNAKNGDVTESINPQASTTGRKRGRKKKTEISLSLGTAANDGVQSTHPQASTTGRKRGRKKKTEISLSPGTAANDGVQLEEKVKESSLSNKRKKKEDSDGHMEGEAKEESEKNLMSRERKKSKYLSPPYTNHSGKGGKLITKRELETESEKITKIARVGERITEAAGQLIVSPPISKCNGVKSDIKTAEGRTSGLEKSGISPQTVKQKEKKIIDSKDVGASVCEVLAEVRSAGVNLMSLGDGSIEMIKGFVTAFRSSMYLNGANYKSYHKQKATRKRKSSVPESENLGDDVNQANNTSPQPLMHNEKIERPRSRVTKLKKAARAAATNKREVDKKASPVSLIVTFTPGASLPSKDETIKIFSSYGHVNEDETEVLLDSNCAQVAYTSISDAEEAFRESIKQSPFGASSVGYRLRYSSAAARALESGQKIPTSPKKRTPKNPVGSQPTDDEISQVGFIKQKLEMLTSMLESCNGKISSEEKSSLEGEIRSLLQKVSALAVKTSS